MGNIVFRCPRTGMNVQHWRAEEVAPDTPLGAYDAVVCNACARTHFINRLTGKLLGDKETAAAETAADPVRSG